MCTYSPLKVILEFQIFCDQKGLLSDHYLRFAATNAWILALPGNLKLSPDSSNTVSGNLNLNLTAALKFSLKKLKKKTCNFEVLPAEVSKHEDTMSCFACEDFKLNSMLGVLLAIFIVLKQFCDELVINYVVNQQHFVNLQQIKTTFYDFLMR